MFLKLDDNRNGRPFLPTNSCRALKQRLLRTPEPVLVSLAGTRWSKQQSTSPMNQYQLFTLQQDLSVWKAVLYHIPTVYPSNTFLKNSLPNEFLEVHSPE